MGHRGRAVPGALLVTVLGVVAYGVCRLGLLMEPVPSALAAAAFLGFALAVTGLAMALGIRDGADG